MSSPVTKNQSSDTSRCPLCGQANQCAISAGLPPESCWCMQTRVSQNALARLPSEARGKSCICPACAQDIPSDSNHA
ncbi:MAG: cysteine-rich CWC family protein [Comamonas sp.]|uniref:cysteine-rich CWC family protein n=1 Tax=Comamonas sp. TaxID=34028 RepID=UPI00281B6B61|nr:cysteine-rich CWC family protein [Comamonas sp.]MDR0214649.1 cysteine-rich CWC family protein [Comamonas sp.]